MATAEVSLDLFLFLQTAATREGSIVVVVVVVSAAMCGQRLDNTLNRPMYRMFGGRESDITEQPWQALINVYQPRHKQYHHKCGGVLIDSCWVLSAAHCFDEE